MNEMNKELEYRGYRFNIKVELYHSAERHPGGRVQHQVTINDMGATNYYFKELVDDNKLLGRIVNLESTAKAWVDAREDGPVKDKLMQQLHALGFK